VISSKTKNRMIRKYERSYRKKVLANEKMFEYEREKSKTKESRKTSLKILKIEIERSSNNYVILIQMYNIKQFSTQNDFCILFKDQIFHN